jgi:hypothetical protein
VSLLRRRDAEDAERSPRRHLKCHSANSLYY